MKKMLAVLVLMVGLGGFALAEKACKKDEECKSEKAARFCNLESEFCSDCCEFVEKIVCPPVCTWSKKAKECRNEKTVACGASPIRLAPAKPVPAKKR